MATPGPVAVAFGAPLRLQGDDYAALAKQVEEAVRQIWISQLRTAIVDRTCRLLHWLARS